VMLLATAAAAEEAQQAAAAEEPAVSDADEAPLLEEPVNDETPAPAPEPTRPPAATERKPHIRNHAAGLKAAGSAERWDEVTKRLVAHAGSRLPNWAAAYTAKAETTLAGAKTEAGGPIFGASAPTAYATTKQRLFFALALAYERNVVVEECAAAFAAELRAGDLPAKEQARRLGRAEKHFGACAALGGRVCGHKPLSFGAARAQLAGGGDVHHGGAIWVACRPGEEGGRGNAVTASARGLLEEEGWFPLVGKGTSGLGGEGRAWWEGLGSREERRAWLERWVRVEALEEGLEKERARRGLERKKDWEKERAKLLRGEWKGRLEEALE
jgi:hypothetical protein